MPPREDTAQPGLGVDLRSVFSTCLRRRYAYRRRRYRGLQVRSRQMMVELRADFTARSTGRLLLRCAVACATPRCLPIMLA